jgi:cell division protein FtsB
MAASPRSPRPRRAPPRHRRAAAPQRHRAAATPHRRAARPVARIGRDRLYGGLLLALVVVLAVMAAGPYADYTAAQSRVDELQARHDGLTAAVAELEVEAERLQDPAALEEQARSQLGLVRPGEIPYIVTNPETEPPVPVNAQESVASTEEAPTASLWSRVVGWVTALTRAG